MPTSLPSFDQKTDDQLMLAFAGGDRTSFDQLFDRYRQRVYAFYRRRIADQARAEELTQETFLVVLRTSARYQPRTLFRAYLFAIAFRILKSERRRLATRAFFFLPSANNEPTRREATDEILWLRQALSGLETTEREMLMLREFEQLSYAEIADLLELPVNTVRSRLFRARMALRENLQGKTKHPDSAIEKGQRP